MFCSLAEMGVTLVEERKASITAGDGCDVAGQSLDDFGGKLGQQGLCHSGGLERACSAAGRLMASVLGRTAQRVRPSGMLCQQKRADQWHLADATSNPAMSQRGSF